MATLADLMTIIDPYMGGEPTGKYVADKIKDLFEGKQSPFNTKDGVLKTLSDKLNELVKHVAKLLDPHLGMPNLVGIVNLANSNIHGLSTWANKVMLSMKKLDAMIAKIQLKFPTVPKTTGSVGGRKTFNVRVTSISPSVILQLINKLKEEAILGNSKPTTVVNNITNNRSITNKNTGFIKDAFVPFMRESKSFFGNLFSTIIKWVPDILLGMFAVGGIDEYLDKTPGGRYLKMKIGDGLDYISKMITDFIHSGKIEKFFNNTLDLIKNLSERIKNLYNANKEKIGEMLDKTWNFFRDDVFKPLKAAISKFFNENADKIVEALGEGLKFLLTDVIYPIFSAIARRLTGGLSDFVEGLVRFVWNVFTGDWDEAFNMVFKMRDGLSGIVEFLKNLGKYIWHTLHFDFKSAEKDLQKMKDGFMSWITGVVVAVLAWFSLERVPLLGWIFKGFRWLVTKMTTGIGRMLKVAGQYIWELFKVNPNAIKNIGGKLLGWVPRLFGLVGRIIPIIAAAYAAFTAIKNVIDKFNLLGKIANERQKDIEKGEELTAELNNKVLDPKIEKHKQEIETLKAKKDKTEEDFLQMQIERIKQADIEATKAHNESLARIQKESNTLMARIGGLDKWMENISEWFGGPHVEDAYEIATQEENERFRLLQKTRQEQIKQLEENIKREKEGHKEVEKSHNKVIDSIEDRAKKIEKEFKKSTEQPLSLNKDENKTHGIQPRKVADALIIEPHSKDQIVMAKENGPFDLVMKDMVKKFDEMMGLMGEGFGQMISATANGSNMVAGAVASTASAHRGGVNSNVTGSSGADPIRDFRDRARRAIESIA